MASNTNNTCSKPTDANYNFVPRYITERCGIGATMPPLAFDAKTNGVPLDLTPYDITAPILPRDGKPPPVAALTVSKIAVPPPPDPASVVSRCTISLTAAETLALGGGVKLRPIVWEWCIWFTNPLTLESILFQRGALILYYPPQPMIITPPTP